MKRVFLFAFYDPQGIVGETVLYELRALRQCGEVLLACDCDLAPGEERKLEGLARTVWTRRHGEYDFGSYKRAFAAASLQDCDVLYLVNDSVVGPLRPLKPVLEELEDRPCAAFSLVLNPSRHGAHLQSWFIGLKPAVFLADWFAAFLQGVEALGSKTEVCVRYETGLTRLLEEKGQPYSALMTVSGKKIYNDVLALCRRGLPFFKRSALTRHGGSLGGQVERLLDQAPEPLRQALRVDTDRLLGEGYLQGFLTRNPFRLTGRYLKYLKAKLKK